MIFVKNNYCHNFTSSCHLFYLHVYELSFLQTNLMLALFIKQLEIQILNN